MNKEIFEQELKKLNISITQEQKNQLDTFYKLLVEWNKKMNLTGITEENQVYLKHFYDSLTLVKAIDLTKPIKLCDVGSGAGFPGIVLKIVFPNLDITLIDSLKKRINYLNEVINQLGLNNIRAIHCRMEDFSKENSEKFDVITARAVANTKLLTEISIKALKIHGQMIFMKANIDDELNDIDKLFNELGCFIKNKIEFNLPIENSTRTLLVITKNKKTPNKYPRRIDQIKKIHCKK